MTWLVAKEFLGKAGDWIAAHWQLCLFALMAFAIWHYKSAYESGVKELSAYKQAATDESDKQKADNKLKLDKAKDTQAKSDKINNQQIADLHIDKETLTNAIKGYYAPKTIVNKPSVVHSVFTGTASNTEPSTEVASSGQGLASSEPITDPACARLQTQLGALEEAAALETVLYNKAKARIDQDCDQIGCEDSPIK